MKKLAGIMALMLLVSMLGGCYKADTTLDFTVNGGVEVTSTLLGTPEMYTQAGIANPDELVETFAPETIEMYSSMYGLPETGERVDLVRVDAAGNEIAEGTALPEDGSMVGTRLRMKYASFADAANSFTLINYLRATPLMQDESGYGLKVEEKRNLFGTKYIASGKISVYGSEMYKTEYDGADAAVKEQIAGSSASITFKFPLAFSKSNADQKGFLGQSLTWTATADAPEKEVYFEVTTINPVILGMALVILILLVVIIVLARRRRDDEPDAYFVDADGNPIPVYDTEDAEEADMDEYEEEMEETIAQEMDAVEEAAEPVTEIIEEAAEPAEEAEDDKPAADTE